MSDSKTIENVVKSFVSTEVSFTSVDIANEIKKMGIWIRNREIANELKSLLYSSMPNYTTSEIKVKRAEDSVEVTATLYHHVSKDIDDYLNTEAEPLKPMNFFKSEAVKKKLNYLDKEEKIDTKEKNKINKSISAKSSKIKTDNSQDKVSVDDGDPSIKVNKSPFSKGFTKSKRDYATFNFL